VDYAFYDVVVHLGLGVYDNFTDILIEDGAFNLRCDHTDALGHRPPSKRLAQQEEDSSNNRSPICDILQGTAATKQVVSRLAAAAASSSSASSSSLPLPGGFRLKVVGARPENSYICNETHWRALTALHEVGVGNSDGESSQSANGRLRAAYFVHIPYAQDRTDHRALAEAVADVVAHLVSGSLSA
jgi:hypothetical protein